ncbi:hypothetical protein Dimus_021265 [Dionaea muscipula]
MKVVRNESALAGLFSCVQQLVPAKPSANVNKTSNPLQLAATFAISAARDRWMILGGSITRKLWELKLKIRSCVSTIGFDVGIPVFTILFFAFHNSTLQVIEDTPVNGFPHLTQKDKLLGGFGRLLCKDIWPCMPQESGI